MGKLIFCIGLPWNFLCHPTPGTLYVSDDRLGAHVDMHVLDGDLLLTLPPDGGSVLREASRTSVRPCFPD